MAMYGAILPSYDKADDKEQKEENVIDADDPNNRDEVRKFLENID